jgi:hypothetical protein
MARGVAVLVLLLVLLGSFSAWTGPVLSWADANPSAAAAEATIEYATVDDGSPEGVTEAFYRWYLTAGAPAAAGAYVESPYLSPRLLQRVDALVAAGESEVGDPFLCTAQSIVEMRIGTADVVGDEATVLVTVAYGLAGMQRFMVALEREADGWRMVNVSCGSAQTMRGSAGWR